MDEFNGTYCTAKDAAAYFDVHPFTIHNWIRSGKLEAIKPGRSYLITTESLRALIRRSRV